MTVAFTLESLCVGYKANKVSLYVMLKDFKLHTLGLQEPLKVLSKHMTL